MNKDLQESRSLSLRFEVNLQTYRFIIGDGYRWDIFRRVFDHKKWYPEGTEIGKQFVRHAVQTRFIITGDGMLLYYDKEFMRVEMVTRSMIDDEYNNYIRFKVNSSVIME